LPIFVSLTQDVKPKIKKKIVIQSMWTAMTLALVFIFLGKLIFRFLGITVADFMVAGGILLFCIAIRDIFDPGKDRHRHIDELGAVPLGTPLIVGPAVLTTSLILVDEYGVAATLIAVMINILLACFIFLSSDAILKVIGQSGSRALSKVMALLLAAIAIMMIRKGITRILTLPLL